jgi:hypothetical protein
MKKQGGSKSFLDTYLSSIVPVFEKIDLLVRLNGKNIPIAVLAEALGLDKAEIRGIMAAYGFKRLNRENMIYVLKEGSSDPCKLFRRELERGMPLVYTRSDIAYIYGINRENVEAVCDELNIVETTARNFRKIFSRLPANGA